MMWILLTVFLLPATSANLKSKCDIQPAEVGEDATLNVSFSEDLSKLRSVDFSIDHIRHDSNKALPIIRCRSSHGEVKCDNNTCCTPGKRLTDLFHVVIHNVSQQYIGRFGGFVNPVDYNNQKFCNFTLKASYCSIHSIRVRNSVVYCSAQPIAVGDSCNVTCNDIDSEQKQQLSETYTCVGKNEWHPVIIPHQCNERLQCLETDKTCFICLLTLIPIAIAVIIAMKRRFTKKKENPWWVYNEEKMHSEFQKRDSQQGNKGTLHMNPLLQACFKGDNNSMKHEVEAGTNVNVTEENGISPLYAACEHNHITMVEYLLDNGACVDLARQDGRTPLYIACSKGHTAVVGKLLKRHANMNVIKAFGDTPLHVACYKGHLEVVKLLLDKGSKINTLNRCGGTPLRSACYKGHIDLVELLIRKGADVNIADKDHDSPLLIACYKGHIKIVNILLQENATVNANKNWGRTPLLVACKNVHTDIVKALLHKHADVNIKTLRGKTPLHVACKKGNTEITREILKKVEDVNIQRLNGKTALYIACEAGHIDIVNVLLEYEADVNVADIDGRTPLYVADKAGNKAIIEVLVQNGAARNLPDNVGNNQSLLECQSSRVRLSAEVITFETPLISEC